MVNLGVIIDIETTGLDPLKNVIVEVGAIVFYRDTFQPVGQFSKLIITDETVQHLKHTQVDNDYVYNMHKNSGLYDEVMRHYEVMRRNGVEKYTLTKCEDALIDFLAQFNIGKNHLQLPAIGSSVHFDRKFLDIHMPRVGREALHYRNIDISSIKMAAQYWTPQVANMLEANSNPKRLHRVLDDCLDSLNELEFYITHIFKRAQFSWENGDEVD